MKSIFLLILLLSFVAYGQTESALIFGKATVGSLKWANVSGTPVDSINVSGTPINCHYEITVLSVTTGSGGIAVLSYTDLLTGKRITKQIVEGTKDLTTVSGIRVCFNAALTVGNMVRFQFSDRQPAKVDSVGGIFSALWDYAKSDTVTTITATPDTLVLSGDYPQGLTIMTDLNLQFRSNRITGWIFVPMGFYLSFPVRHIAGDTIFTKTATIPDFMVIRGR